MSDIAIRIEHLPIDDLVPDPANPRRISEAELDSLTRGIRGFGFVDPVIARREDMVVIGGHQRLLAARRIGMKNVPTVLLDISVKQARSLNLALNRISGEWDEELLGRVLANIRDDADIALTGFAEDEIDKLLRNMESQDKAERLETFDLDEFLAGQNAESTAKPGDMWILGDHKLLCGDSTNASDVSRLFDGRKASLMATDPPYMVGYDGGSHPGKSRGDALRKQCWKNTYVEVENWDEDKGSDETASFYHRYLLTSMDHLADDAALYQWHASARQALVEKAWRDSGLLVHQQIIWVKGGGVMTHSHYLWAHEPCMYGWRQGSPPLKRPPSSASTAWEVDRKGSAMGIHPTQKPLELFTRPIEYHTDYGDVVYEPFSGSGTQIIAAEKLGRICYAVEQSPRFVDVAVKRWEAFTGKEAFKGEGDGTS